MFFDRCYVSALFQSVYVRPKNGIAMLMVRFQNLVLSPKRCDAMLVAFFLSWDNDQKLALMWTKKTYFEDVFKNKL